ncbi:extracellular solute-binding protein [Haematomicrobium sanguinis]|uniref:extracellular solute-binding protein n=1 Tax=Haematomicrobium sanguinis TaxID=479106 RepID=UPI000A058A79|nr:extracellular solute-binding protein [Haematomicrobium sanguinis]
MRNSDSTLASHTKPGAVGTSRRTFLGGMALSLAAVGLAGCSGGGAAARSDLDPNRILPPEGGPEFTLIDTVQYPPNYVGPKAYTPKPIVTEKVTLKVATTTDASIANWDTNKVSKWMEERTGVSVEWITLPSGADLTSKVNAMIGSNDLPDVFFNPYGTVMSPAMLNQDGAAGVLIELDEIIDKYCPNAKMALSEYKDQISLLRSTEGKLYTFPTINDCYHCRSAAEKIWINQNVLDKIGAEIPTTTEEFVEALRAAKELDPQMQTYTTWSDGGAQQELRWDMPIMGSLTYFPGTSALALNKDGQVILPAITDEARNGFAFFAQLNREGLVNPKWWNQTIEQLQRVTPEDRAFIVASPHPGVMTKVSDPAINRWKSMAPMSGPDGTRIAAWNYYGGADTGGLITRACKTPEVAAAWMDLMLEMEATLTTTFGPRGVTWEWSPEGAKGFTGEQAIYAQKSGPDNKDWWGQLAPNFRSLSYRDGEQVVESQYNFEQVLRLESERNYAPYQQPQEWQLPQVPLTTEEATAALTPQTDINTYLVQAITAFANGAKDPESEDDWKAFVKGATDRGVETLTSTYQTAWNRFKQLG